MRKLFGLDFYEYDIDKLCKELAVELDRKQKKISIYTPNVDHIISTKTDARINMTYEKADILIADGWPLVLISKLKNMSIYKITGVDLMERLLQIANAHKFNLFFLGSTNYTLECMITNIRKEYTEIQNIGCYNGYFDEKQNQEVIDLINNNNTDILFVGMSHPKQEIWIDANKEKLNSTLMIAVGGGFKIFSKEIKRAPYIVQKLYLEWFWRFLKEPRRLFKRYFIRYPKFIGIAMKELLNK